MPESECVKRLVRRYDRLKRPVKRVRIDGEASASEDSAWEDCTWEEIGWDEAFDLVANKLHHIQQAHGNNAVGVYLGNPNAHNMGSILFGPYFYRALKSHNRYSATSVDQLPHHIVSRRLCGHISQIPIPDIDHTQHFMIIGGNPLASNGSIMTVPNVKKRLTGIQKRGGRSSLSTLNAAKLPILAVNITLFVQRWRAVTASYATCIVWKAVIQGGWSFTLCRG